MYSMPLSARGVSQGGALGAAMGHPARAATRAAEGPSHGRLASVRYWYEGGPSPVPQNLPPTSQSAAATRYPPRPPMEGYRSTRSRSLPLPGCREVLRGSKIVEIPNMRTLMTPVIQEKVVNTVRKELVPTTQYVQDVEYVVQQEPYVDYEQRPTVRMKEVWVRQMVPETVFETVPVQRTRPVTVSRPVTREVTSLTEVEVPVTEVVQESCYRIDEVHEVAKAEVDVCQEVEWVPRIVAQWEENERLVSDWHATYHRTLGYEPAVPAPPPVHSVTQSLASLPRANVIGVDRVYPYGGMYDEKMRISPFKQTINPVGNALPVGSVVRIATTPIEAVRNNQAVAGNVHSQVQGQETSPRQQFRIHIGMSLMQVKDNLVIKDVAPQGLAEQAGLQAGDVVVAIDGVPVTSHGEFQSQIRGKASFEIDVFDEEAQQYFKRIINASPV